MDAGMMQLRFRWPPHDSTEIILRASMHPCRGGAGYLLTGVDGGNGVLVWIRSAKGLVGGDYPLIARGDSTTARGAMLSTRFMVGEIARGFALDSGQVTITASGPTFSVTARGSGLDYSAGQRVSLAASGTSLPVSSDTLRCGIQL